MPDTNIRLDYLIVGQGIAGTLLSYELLQAGKSVMVLDPGKSNRSSLVAGAVINPMAGKHWTPSPDAQRFIPTAINTYRALETLLDINIVRKKDLIVFHESAEHAATFADKQRQFPEKISEGISDAGVDAAFHNSFGAGRIEGLWLADASALLQAWQKLLEQKGCYLQEAFDFALLEVKDNGVTYKTVEATTIVFCEGAAAVENPFFHTLPFTRNRGEALLLKIPGLSAEHIYHRGLRLVPKGDDLFWCGSNYSWNFDHLLPDETWRAATIGELNSWLKIPFTVIDHIVAQRPTTAGQFPLIGLHPKYKTVAIFNGLGTRGFSAGPYWAKAFSAILTGKTDELPDYDQTRFRKFFPI